MYFIALSDELNVQFINDRSFYHLREVSFLEGLLLCKFFNSVDSKKLSACCVNNDTTGALGFMLCCCVIFDPSYIFCSLALNDDTTRFSLDICFDVANCVLFYTEACNILLTNIKKSHYLVCYLALDLSVILRFIACYSYVNMADFLLQEDILVDCLFF